MSHLPNPLIGWLANIEGQLCMWSGRDWRETTEEDVNRDRLRYTVEEIEREKEELPDW